MIKSARATGKANQARNSPGSKDERKFSSAMEIIKPCAMPARVVKNIKEKLGCISFHPSQLEWCP